MHQQRRLHRSWGVPDKDGRKEHRACRAWEEVLKILIPLKLKMVSPEFMMISIHLSQFFSFLFERDIELWRGVIKKDDWFFSRKVLTKKIFSKIPKGLFDQRQLSTDIPKLGCANFDPRGFWTWQDDIFKAPNKAQVRDNDTFFIPFLDDGHFFVPTLFLEKHLLGKSPQNWVGIIPYLT